MTNSHNLNCKFKNLSDIIPLNETSSSDMRMKSHMRIKSHSFIHCIAFITICPYDRHCSLHLPFDLLVRTPTPRTGSHYFMISNKRVETATYFFMEWRPPFLAHLLESNEFPVGALSTVVSKFWGLLHQITIVLFPSLMGSQLTPLTQTGYLIIECGH